MYFGERFNDVHYKFHVFSHDEQIVNGSVSVTANRPSVSIVCPKEANMARQACVYIRYLGIKLTP